MQTKELQERQEQALFDNELSLRYLSNGKTKDLAKYLKMQALRLRSGMTAEEIDAVIKRAAEAFEVHQAD